MAVIQEIQNRLDQEVGLIVRDQIRKEMIVSKGVTYSDFFSDKMLMIRVIREGVSYSFFNLIQDYSPFSEEDWARILDISTKTLQRYKQTSKSFRSLHSEKIIELAEVSHIGADVFGDMEKFKLWLNTPNFALGNYKPMELLSDSYGKEMVVGELTRINHGILA